SVFRFDIFLPYSAPEQKERIDYPKLDLSGKRALVVDDLEVNCRILSAYLTNWGMECDIACSAREALTLLERSVQEKKIYDIALVDRQMPQVSGTTLAKKIKEKSSLKHIPLVMITSSSSGEISSPDEILSLGFLGFVMKPYHPL